MTNLAYDYYSHPDTPYEMIGGKIKMMAWAKRRHINASKRITYLFQHFFKGKVCDVYPDMAIHIDKDTYYRPDISIVCDPDIVDEDGIHGAPSLVVEILSKSTAMYDRTHKMEVYAKLGVPEYWLVTPLEETIEVYLLKDGKYMLDNIHVHMEEREYEPLLDTEKAQVSREFSPSMFPDLVIQMSDVFPDTFSKNSK